MHLPQELVESESGSLYLRELLDQRWAELKEASAEYQAIREMFWARVHELTTGRRAVARTASSSSLGKRGEGLGGGVIDNDCRLQHEVLRHEWGGVGCKMG